MCVCVCAQSKNSSAYRGAHYFACYINHAEFFAFGERRCMCASYGEQAGGHIRLGSPLFFDRLAVNIRHRLGPVHMLRIGRRLAFSILKVGKFLYIRLTKLNTQM